MLVVQQQLMNFTFLLMRHAYSTHNGHKDKWKQNNKGDKSYKKLPQYASTKFSPALIDSPQIDLGQCDQITAFIDFSKIALVLCSPLKRCLETCKQMIKNQNDDVPVMVQPLLTNRLSASWSIGSNAEVLANSYKEFDFSAFRDCPQDWAIKLLPSRLTNNSKKQCQVTTQFQLLERIKNGECESYEQFFLRTRKLKQRIGQILSNFTLRDSKKKQILVISHSCVLSFLLGSELSQKGKVKNKISFEHCKPVQFQSHLVLGPFTEPLLQSK